MSQNNLYEFPIRVRWVGWESDTYSLRRAGWQISASEQMAGYKFEKTVCISARDPESKIVIMGRFDIPMRWMMAVERDLALVDLLTKEGVDMQLYRATDRVVIYTKMPGTWNQMNAMAPIDGFAYLDMSGEQHDIGELQLFRYSEVAKEIYLPPKSVDECLNRILELQFPEQTELKKKEGQVIEPVIQAKIYSLAA